MKKIVQLDDYEYKKLADLAKLNEQGILEKALSLWKEKGVAEIRIKIDAGKDWEDSFSIKCDTYFWNKDEKFQVPFDIRQRFRDIIKSNIDFILEEKYGEPVEMVNKLNKRIYEVSRLRIILYGIAASGWAAFIGYCVFNKIF